jgi:hypothetical protein
MAKKTSRLCDSIEQAIADYAPASRKSWFDKLPTDAKHDLGEIRSRFQDGKYEAHSLSAVVSAIIGNVTAHLTKPPSHDAVMRWLRATR